MALPLEPGAENAVRSRYAVLRLIGIAMIAAVFFYGAVARIVSARAGWTAPGSQGMLKTVLIFLGIATAAAIPAVVRFLSSRQTERIPARTLAGSGLETLYSRYLVVVLVPLGLAETLAIYGLVLMFMTQSFADFLVFAIPSAALMVYYFPRYEAWEEWIRSHVDFSDSGP